MLDLNEIIDTELDFDFLGRPQDGAHQDAKRDRVDGEKDDERPRSNKKRVVEQGHPVALPVFGQNLLGGEDRGITDEARSSESLIRHAIEQLYLGNGGSVSLDQVYEMLRDKRVWVEQQWGRAIWKPGTLAVMEQMRCLLQELEAMADALKAESEGEGGEGGAYRCVVVQDDCLGRPLKQEEEAGDVVVRVVGGPKARRGQGRVEDAKVEAVGADGASIDLGLKLGQGGARVESPSAGLWNLVFPTISIKKGTRKKVCHLKFSCKAGGRRLECPRLSRGFVVQTNEKQWAEGLGAVLVQRMYGEGRHADKGLSRNAVCNDLQLAYLRGTRQHMLDPSRPLSPHDFNYLLKKQITLSGDIITRAQFEQLWEWFGSMLSRIRHDRQVLEMWTQGYIMGFVGKEEADEFLIKEPPGAFLLRFSSQSAGSFAIAYTAPDGKSVNHYLIKKSEVNVAQSLAKFLLEKHFFSVLLQTVPSFEERRWQRAEKDKALSKWESAVKPEAPVAGYDESLLIPFQKLQIK